MPPVQSEDLRGAAGPLTDSPRGLFTYPEGVVARASGWQTPIGTCRGITIERFTTSELTWDRVDIEEMRLGRASTLLLTQGMQLSRLFPPDVTFYDGTRPVLWFHSPALLLKRTPTELFQVPPKLRKVVLGVVVHAKELSEEQLRASMLAVVLG